METADAGARPAGDAVDTATMSLKAAGLVRTVVHAMQPGRWLKRTWWGTESNVRNEKRRTGTSGTRTKTRNTVERRSTAGHLDGEQNERSRHARVDNAPATGRRAMRSACWPGTSPQRTHDDACAGRSSPAAPRYLPRRHRTGPGSARLRQSASGRCDEPTAGQLHLVHGPRTDTMVAHRLGAFCGEEPSWRKYPQPKALGGVFVPYVTPVMQDPE